MKKSVELTVTLKLNVDYAIRANEFYESFETKLRTGLGDILVSNPNCVRVVAAYDPDGELHRDTDLTKTLEPLGQIADIWTVEDVFEIRPDLNRSQALRVLQLCASAHDANFGITWDTLSFAAEQCFGEARVTAWDLCG